MYTEPEHGPTLLSLILNIVLTISILLAILNGLCFQLIGPKNKKYSLEYLVLQLSSLIIL